jgi:Amino-transferase class IV
LVDGCGLPSEFSLLPTGYTSGSFLSQVTEAGASNFFVVWETKEGERELITPPLDAKVILEGVTRGSVLELARERLIPGSEYLTSNVQDVKVAERNLTMLEIEEAWKDGRIIEIFVSGTAVSWFCSLAGLMRADCFSTSSLPFRPSISVMRRLIFLWEMVRAVIMLLF